MLAYHYLAALELSRAAGLDVSSLAAPAHRALREAGDRAFCALCLRSGRPLLRRGAGNRARTATRNSLFRHAEALFRSGNEDGMRALEEAREALVAAGRASALLRPSLAGRRRGGIAETAIVASTHLARAEEIVRDQAAERGEGASAEPGLTLSRDRWRYRAGDLGGQEALAIAEQLGLDELRAHALNNISRRQVERGTPRRSDLGCASGASRSRVAINSPEAARGLQQPRRVPLGVRGMEGGASLCDRRQSRVGERLGNLHIVRYSRAARSCSTSTTTGAGTRPSQLARRAHRGS